MLLLLGGSQLMGGAGAPAWDRNSVAKYDTREGALLA
jgi:hypothetical protein